MRSRSLIAVGLAALVSLTAPDARASSVTELVREAREHEAANRDELAVRRYTEALALDPTYGDAYLGLGALRARRGDAREAERVYSVALAHLPTLRAALVGRAEARWALGFHDDAEQDMEDYVRGQDDPAALRELARWYGTDERVPAALAAWRRLRALAPHAEDGSLEREARTMVRALQILVGEADPVIVPAEPSRTRRGLAAIARRGG